MKSPTLRDCISGGHVFAISTGSRWFHFFTRWNVIRNVAGAEMGYAYRLHFLWRLLFSFSARNCISNGMFICSEGSGPAQVKGHSSAPLAVHVLLPKSSFMAFSSCLATEWQSKLAARHLTSPARRSIASEWRQSRFALHSENDSAEPFTWGYRSSAANSEQLCFEYVGRCVIEPFESDGGIASQRNTPSRWRAIERSRPLFRTLSRWTQRMLLNQENNESQRLQNDKRKTK